MNFIRRIGRDEIYIKYVHQLVNVSFAASGSMFWGLMSRHEDASPVAKLRRGGPDTEAPLGSVRVGS